MVLVPLVLGDYLLRFFVPTFHPYTVAYKGLHLVVLRYRFFRVHSHTIFTIQNSPHQP
jgi:hypothetical protein